MSEALRVAARRRLAKFEETVVGGVTRVTLDVSVDGTTELVTLALRDGELAVSSSGTDAHVAAALRFVAEDASEEPSVLSSPAREPPGRVSWEPAEPSAEGFKEPAPRVRLADALDDVVTTVVRVGVDDASSPSIVDALERLQKELPLPIPAGMSRWLGRLRGALDGGDGAGVAKLLDGASRLAEDLRRETATPEARRRAIAWLGALPAMDGTRRVADRVSDRTLVEIAREQLQTSERGGLERRYLVDLRDGEVFREERARSDPNASVGPCPRVIQVGLAEVERGGTPRRIRLMQYAVTLSVGKAELRKLRANGYRRFSALADRYRDWVNADPGQAEPFVVVVPKTWKHRNNAPVSYDDDGVPLAFARADDPAAVEVLGELTDPAPRWIAGRLLDARGSLLMMPCVVAVPHGQSARLYRLR